MNSALSPQRLAWFFLLTAFALLLCHSWYGPDIWYHLTWGRDLLSSSDWAPVQHTLIRQPALANPYWLFQILMYWSYERGGILLGSAFLASAWLGVIWLWLNLSQALYKPVIGYFLFIGTVLTLQLRFEHRPEVFSYLFMLFTIRWILKKRSNDESGREFASLFIIQMLWTNMHGFFALGPILTATYLLTSLINKNGDLRRALVALSVTCLASLATPFGWGNWSFIWAYIQIGQRLRDFNAELFPPTFAFTFWPFAIFWLLFFIMAALCLRAIWLRRFDFVFFVAIGGMVLSSQASRNMPLLTLMGAPMLATLPSMSIKDSWNRLCALTVSILAILLIWATVTSQLHRSTGSLGSFGVRIEPSAYPAAATEFLRNHSFKGRLFTDSYDGGYVEYHLPDVQVAGDSYFSDPILTLALFNATRDPNYLAQLNAQVGFEAFLINVENLEVLETLLNDPNLVLVHADSHRSLFLPKQKAMEPDNASVAARSLYFQGEDLSNWNNAIGVVTWSAVFRKHRWRQPMLKVLKDIQTALHVPSALLKIAMSFAEETKDHEIAELTLALLPRLYETEPGQKTEVLELEQKLGACCQ